MQNIQIEAFKIKNKLVSLEEVDNILGVENFSCFSIVHKTSMIILGEYANPIYETRKALLCIFDLKVGKFIGKIFYKNLSQ